MSKNTGAVRPSVMRATELLAIVGLGLAYQTTLGHWPSNTDLAMLLQLGGFGFIVLALALITDLATGLVFNRSARWALALAASSIAMVTVSILAG